MPLTTKQKDILDAWVDSYVEQLDEYLNDQLLTDEPFEEAGISSEEYREAISYIMAQIRKRF